MSKTPPDSSSILATRVKIAREALDISQAELAERVGMKQTGIGSIESGEVQRPRKLREIARVLGVSQEWLLGEEDASEASESPLITSYDPDDPSVDACDDGQMTIGSETGRRGVPNDASAQLDVTAGMGGGGLTIVADGVPGKSGMTFAAEHVRDYWRLPPEILAALGMRAHDVTIVAVQGDSMSSTLNEGDHVFVDTRHRWPSPDGLYCLTDDFGGLIVKRLEVISSPGEDITVRIISDNDRHAPKERLLSDIRIIGRVVRRFGVVE
ncbi:XRE family transcriptional regulator [Castellaniella sp.]|uniref:XRE family transcriptional regulator n=1 Tax=Castellaniella sp. TaxID=1955812 RepID=UPI002AFDFB4D|nr:S24 family peptidase [Castellaniella sp.]